MFSLPPATNRLHRPRDLEHEHLVLLRGWAKLQQRIDTLRQEQTGTVQRLQAEVLRLRGQLVVRHTQVLWGLGPSGFARHSPSTTAPTDAPAPGAATRQVLCQTGCVGHAHAWLAPDHGCRLDGAPCDRVPAPHTTAFTVPPVASP